MPFLPNAPIFFIICLHLLKLPEQPVDVLDPCPAAGGDPPLAGRVDDRGVLPAPAWSSSWIIASMTLELFIALFDVLIRDLRSRRGASKRSSESEPIFLICCICSSRSFMSKAFFASSFWRAWRPLFRRPSPAAFSIRVSTSPIPRIREAIRSGWKGSMSSSFSPVPENLIGLPVTCLTEMAAPPRVSRVQLGQDDAGDRQALY